ncbi:sugar ABC transporter permease [Rhodoferax sp.]|uniref:carbohydrate ABC transporter permease n=1 Tax=Rhodoferax sp. TaxID=50421 RepID=UPI0025D35F07|nr:sugar ABC transporter permease [Rhodoferax sp.]
MNRSFTPYALILPSALFLVLVLVWPLAETVLIALRGDDGGWTLSFLTKMATDANFSLSMRNTLSLVAVVVPLQISLSLGLGYMLGKLPFGRQGFLYAWALPLGISDLAAGLVWLAILTQRGFLPSFLNGIGLTTGPLDMLSYLSPTTLFIAIVVAEVWRATPIVLIIIVSGLQVIPKEYDEAARVFGATAWQRFWHVTLPLIKPSLQTALILRTVMAFEVFAVVFALAGRDYSVLVGEAYQWQNAYQNSHVAAAYAMVILGLSIAATLVFMKTLNVRRETLS